jgi:hypothetical protein
MDWQTLLTDQTGWAVAAALVGAFLRSLMRGDLVLKREYDGVLERANTATEEAKELVRRQGELSERTISSQADLIKSLREGPQK